MYAGPPILRYPLLRLYVPLPPTPLTASTLPTELVPPDWVKLAVPGPPTGPTYSFSQSRIPLPLRLYVPLPLRILPPLFNEAPRWRFGAPAIPPDCVKLPTPGLPTFST